MSILTFYILFSYVFGFGMSLPMFKMHTGAAIVMILFAPLTVPIRAGSILSQLE